MSSNEVNIPDRVVLHLGAHKTASTHFHRLFIHNENLCDPFDLSVPKKKPIRKYFTKILVPSVEITPNTTKEMFEVLSDGRKNLFISDENIIGTPQGLMRDGCFYRNAHAKLQRAFSMLEPVSDVKLMLAIRNPTTFVASSYGETIRSQGFLSFKDYRREMKPKEMSWLDLVHRIKSAMPGLDLLVWRFEDYRKVLPELISYVNTSDPEEIDYSESSGVVRPGLSQKAIDEIKVLCNKFPETTSSDDYEEIVRLYPKSDSFPAPKPWNENQIARLTALYEQDVEAIKKLDDVTFLEP